MAASVPTGLPQRDLLRFFGGASLSAHPDCDHCCKDATARLSNMAGAVGVRPANLRSQSPSFCQLSYAPKVRAGKPAGTAGTTRRAVSASSTADALRALCRPTFLRSTIRASRVRNPARRAAANAYSRRTRQGARDDAVTNGTGLSGGAIHR